MIIAAVMIVGPLAVVTINKNRGNSVKGSPRRNIETIAKSLRNKKIYVQIIERVQKKERSNDD